MDPLFEAKEVRPPRRPKMFQGTPPRILHILVISAQTGTYFLNIENPHNKSNRLCKLPCSRYRYR